MLQALDTSTRSGSAPAAWAGGPTQTNKKNKAFSQRVMRISLGALKLLGANLELGTGFEQGVGLNRSSPPRFTGAGN
jgi:hypothetical protein